MKHPSESELSLFAGGELGFLERAQVRRHVSRCADCRTQSDMFRVDCQARHEGLSELPGTLNWNRMAEEMTANIHVGLAAGECVGPVRGVRRMQSWNLGGWGLGALTAGLCALLALGWWMRMPSSDTAALGRAMQTVWTGHGQPAEPLSSSHGVILEADTGGIRVKENGAALTFVSPRSEAVTVSVSLQGSAQARYVDSETGQVTIANVYAQ
ncbi:MAG: zf-HC2 domain-containing protein [Bryobacteraceae bacterium]